MNTKAVDMKHTPEGLLNCARIAYPEYEWSLDGEYIIGVRETGHDGLPKGVFRYPITFSLDNDSDVLALIKGLGKHGVCARPLDTKWYPSNTKYRGTMPMRLYNTLTDCLYAAAMEVGE